MCSANPMITGILCSITNSVMPSSLAARFKRSIRPLIKVGLMPAVGSSSSNTRGSFISAMANSKSFCWPNESSPETSRRF